MVEKGEPGRDIGPWVSTAPAEPAMAGAVLDAGSDGDDAGKRKGLFRR